MSSLLLYWPDSSLAPIYRMRIKRTRHINWNFSGTTQHFTAIIAYTFCHNVTKFFIMPPSLIGGGIKRCFCLTSVCLSVVYIGPKSRTERPRKTKIGIEIAHVTRDSDTTSKVKRSKVKVTRPLYSVRP